MRNRILCVFVLMIMLLCGCDTTGKVEPELITGDELQKMEDARMEERLLIGLWEGPRKHAMSTQEEANSRYEEIKEAGINMVFLYAELGDEDWLNKSLTAAETTGVSLIIDLGGVYTNKKAFQDVMEKTSSSPAVIGYNIVDEPTYKAFGQIKKVADIIREEVGNDKFIFCNLLPTYASAESYAESAKEGMTLYQTYLDTFCETVQGNLLHVDYYPYGSNEKNDEKQLANMLSCLIDMRNIAEKHNIPWGGFLQSSRWGKYLDDGTWSGTRIPNEAEYRFITHLHLCCGAETLSNFLYWSRNGSDPSQRVSGIFDGLITYEGERTEVYDIVKNTNEAVLAMKGVYLSYDHKGFMTLGLDDDVKGKIGDLYFDSYDMVEKLSGDGRFIIGCFEEGNKKGLYIVNYDREGNSPEKIVIDLDQKCSYQLWGAQGLEEAGKSEKIEVSLLPGAGCFIEIEKI